MSTLLDPWKSKIPTGRDLLMLQGDAQLIIVAGRSVLLDPYTLDLLLYQSSLPKASV